MATVWIDVLSVYLFALSWLAVGIALVILVLGVDDLFIDIAYWVRRGARALGVYRRYPKADASLFDGRREQPIAVMIPAWQEADVIGSMLMRAISTLDYENYHIFVGVYPNDPDTNAAVDPVSQRNRNVHKVICARPGPTTKADCLNNIVQAMFDFEKRAGIAFAGYALHDSEDLIGDLELRLFNHLLPAKDLIQLPVYPLPEPWGQFTAWHYADEFAEQHAKDLVVREAILGQVPSAGVGTCFSRRALLRLMEAHEGQPFDVASLTEDYEIALRLHRWDLEQVFVRFPSRPVAEARRDGTESAVVAIREHFPNRFRTAVRQKSRWIIGIMLQGWRNVRWDGGALLKYFLWRDRRALLGHPVAFLANLLVIQLLGLALYQAVAAEPWYFLPVFTDNQLLMTLLWLNAFLLLNRALHRMYFVGTYYGVGPALLALPRMLWANIINFCAMVRALNQFLRAGRGGRLAWDKTAHTFPEVVNAPPLTPLGELLMRDQVLSSQDLEEALMDRQPWERLGQTLLRLGKVTPDALGRALAEQAGTEYRSLDPRALPPDVIAALPAALARKYAVVPLEATPDTIVLASETVLAAVQVNALARRLQRQVRYVMAPQGSVTVALRLHYQQPRPWPDPAAILRAAVDTGALDADRAETIWQRYVAGQYLLGESLVQSGLLEPAVAIQALVNYEHSDQRLGDFLVQEGYITAETLERAVADQTERQPAMRTLLEQAGVPNPLALVQRTGP